MNEKQLTKIVNLHTKILALQGISLFIISISLLLKSLR